MTLEEVIRLIGLKNSDMLYVCTKHCDMDAQPMTLKQVRSKYDTQRTKVKRLYPYHFQYNDRFDWEIVIMPEGQK